MTDKRYCVTCNKYVDTLETIPHEYYDEQKLGCGYATSGLPHYSIPW